MTRFNYKTVTPSKSVVVLAAGPSTGSNIDAIREYIKENDSVVIAANYQYGDIVADYTYFTDFNKLSEKISSVHGDIILRSTISESKHKYSKATVKEFKRLKREGVTVFKIGKVKHNSIYTEKTIRISKEGEFPYSTIGVAGIGSILLSLVFKPEKVLFVGIDGPVIGEKKKEYYDGTIVDYDRESKTRKIINFFKLCMLPHFKNNSITLETFEDCYFYNINKKKNNVKVIK